MHKQTFKRLTSIMLWLALISLPPTTITFAADEYLAYAITKKGEKPLPEEVKPIVEKKAKDLVELRWGSYAGKKIRIGVLEANNESGAGNFQVTSGFGNYENNMNEVPVNAIDALLTDVLTKTSRFRVLTRTEIGEVLDEQDLGASGRVAKPSAAKTGKVLGAEYLVQVVVNSYEPNVSGKKGGLGGFSRKLRAIGGVKAGKNKSAVQMTYRLIDAETSEVLASEVVNSTITDMNLGLGGVGWGGAGAIGGFLSGYSKTPIGQAVMANVNVGVYELVKQLGNLPTTGSVVKVEADRVILNLGEGAVESGQILIASSQGEELIDPETGISLGSEQEVLGSLKVTEVKEKFCYAEPQGFDLNTLSVGDPVTAEGSAAPLLFAESWE